MNPSSIILKCKPWIGRAVVVDFKDEYDDWHHFRIERVTGHRIAFTGMTDNEGNHHDGDFFWANASEIDNVELRL